MSSVATDGENGHDPNMKKKMFQPFQILMLRPQKSH